MPLRCITFDLDDTLWETGPVIARAEAHAHAWLETHAPRITSDWSPPSAAVSFEEFGSCAGRGSDSGLGCGFDSTFGSGFDSGFSSGFGSGLDSGWE